MSDVVLRGDLPDKLRRDAEMYAGCVSGASQYGDYLAGLSKVGFVDIEVQTEKRITIPHEILSQYLSDGEIQDMHARNVGIFSITVYGKKPSDCCDPAGGCC